MDIKISVNQFKNKLKTNNIYTHNNHHTHKWASVCICATGTIIRDNNLNVFVIFVLSYKIRHCFHFDCNQIISWKIFISYSCRVKLNCLLAAFNSFLFIETNELVIVELIAKIISFFLFVVYKDIFILSFLFW